MRKPKEIDVVRLRAELNSIAVHFEGAKYKGKLFSHEMFVDPERRYEYPFHLEGEHPHYDESNEFIFIEKHQKVPITNLAVKFDSRYDHLDWEGNKLGMKLIHSGFTTEHLGWFAPLMYVERLRHVNHALSGPEIIVQCYCRPKNIDKGKQKLIDYLSWYYEVKRKELENFRKGLNEADVNRGVILF